jgi:2-polyprenyl-3-methyl-5-hydroxy-6-metoxy-1,4-benzoquinol methylase
MTGSLPGTTHRLKLQECLICGGVQHEPIFNEFGVDILRCRHCRHVFSSFAADPYYDGFWGREVTQESHVYWSAARSRMHRDFLQRFVAGRSGRLLDMGCGLGFFLKTLAAYPAWEGYGCEISPAAVRYARESLGLHNVITGRLEDADFPQGSFDVVTFWDVIDHLLQPEPVLRRCYALLREKGICFIRTPNMLVQILRARLKRLARGMRVDSTYLMARDHLHHYSESSIQRLLERTGFSRIEFAHLHPIDSTGKSRLKRAIKNASFETVRALAIASRGRLNFDTLFVVAQK